MAAETTDLDELRDRAQRWLDDDPDPASRDPETIRRRFPSIRSHWDGYYSNVAAHLLEGEPLAVTAEQAREVVRILEAALASSREHKSIEGPWG